MKIIMLSIAMLCLPMFLFSQMDYDRQLESFAGDIAKMLDSAVGKKIAVLDIKNNDGVTTKLGKQIAEDLSAELAYQSNNQKKFIVVERNNIQTIIKESKMGSDSDETAIAKELGRRSLADMVATGTITLFGDNYRILIKLIDTKNGYIVNRTKGMVVKTKALEDLDKTEGITPPPNNNAISLISDKPREKPIVDKKDEPKTASDVDCATNQNGDICFKNNTAYEIKITLYKPSPYVSTQLEYGGFEIIVGRGEEGCMYSVGKGSYTYYAVENVQATWGVPFKFEKRGTLVVNACKVWDITLR